MLEKIKEVRAAVANKTYIAALVLALTLPDICSQVENCVSEGNRMYYESWVDKYMDNEAFLTIKGFEKQSFKGNMCYSLRCKLLHNGNIDVKNQKRGINVDDFILVKPGSRRYYHGFRYEITKQPDGTDKYTTIIGVDYLCEALCRTAENYYNNYPNKTLFEEHTFEL